MGEDDIFYLVFRTPVDLGAHPAVADDPAFPPPDQVGLHCGTVTDIIVSPRQYLFLFDDAHQVRVKMIVLPSIFNLKPTAGHRMECSTRYADHLDCPYRILFTRLQDAGLAGWYFP